MTGYGIPGADAEPCVSTVNVVAAGAGEMASLPRVALALLLALSAAGEPARAQPAAGAAPQICRIGVNIEELYDLDMAGDTFGAVLWLWSLCPAEKPAPLETVALPTGTNLAHGELRGSPTGEAGHYQYRRVQGTFRHDWDMRHYPFDRQRLVIPIDETDHGSAVLVFEPDVESSFLSEAIRADLDGWHVSDLALVAAISEVPSTYGMPGTQPGGYARLEASVVLERDHLLAFFKLTAGVFAAALIGLLTLFMDQRDRGVFGSRLGVLTGVLFGVLLSLRAAEAFIGDATRLTLVSNIHLVALALIVAIASISLLERQRLEHGRPSRYPDWPLIAATAAFYVLVNLALVAHAAWH